ncbi:Monoacylglycerol lipase abhd12 [Clonorchis sinensis]|uniref:Monoacylglycerol lipase abhd12 n=2 Tax=Clonorchis sinensis TaxID=79923 RepID=A0A419PE81_CLOSI|nr:Monoacylglycerol lipase abhd12 [Clonorchis sinensis]
MFFLSIIIVHLFIILYLAVPYVLEKWPSFSHSFIFKPKNTSGDRHEYYTCFEQHRLSHKSTRNFYVETADSGDKLGVWHILPYESARAADVYEPCEDLFEHELHNNTPIFIYFHGNTKTRSVPWRIDKYKLLSSLGYNVITFDYRGYGDSSGKMTGELDCVQDSMAILQYVYGHCNSSPVFFWGHSLGTAVVGSLIRHITEAWEMSSSNCLPFPSGIILDAPFTALSQVIIGQKSMWPYRVVPPMRKKMVSITRNLRMEFNTQENLTGCPVPLLILHAKDDPLVPYHLGEKLAKSLESTTDVTFVPFAAERGYRHNFIHTAPEIPDLIRDFVRSSLEKQLFEHT